MWKLRHEEVKICLVRGRAGIRTQAACPPAPRHLTLCFFDLWKIVICARSHRYSMAKLRFEPQESDSRIFLIYCLYPMVPIFADCHWDWFLIHEWVGSRVKEESGAPSPVDKCRKLGWQHATLCCFPMDRGVGVTQDGCALWILNLNQGGWVDLLISSLILGKSQPL